MPDDVEDQDRSWLVQPIGPDEVRVHVELGEGAELSDEVRAALDTLMTELHAVDVEGFIKIPDCPDLSGCKNYYCKLSTCQPQTRWPCNWDEQCAIVEFRVF